MTPPDIPRAAPMICSEARLAANRRNALRSTGPRTAEGKARSRANSLKHGLCATVVVVEDLALVQARATQLYHSLKPQNDYHAWLVDRVAIGSIRIERCERMERRVRDKIALRAELTWDDDRRLEAEILGGLLARRPAETVEALRRTPHGCEWLMTRWAMLARAADTQGGAWTPGQAALAFDLLATPLEFREGRQPGEVIDFEGNMLLEAGRPAAVARRQVAELKERREVVAGLDEVERALAEADLSHDDDAELRRLRRYESTLHRRLRWEVTQINAGSPHKHAAPGLQPRWAEEPAPTPKAEPKTAEEVAAETYVPTSIHPPFCLEPEEYPEPGQGPDIPAVLASRKAKRIAKAQARREARRKRVERLRG